jgi:hypothetical protein
MYETIDAYYLLRYLYRRKFSKRKQYLRFKKVMAERKKAFIGLNLSAVEISDISILAPYFTWLFPADDWFLEEETCRVQPLFDWKLTLLEKVRLIKFRTQQMSNFVFDTKQLYAKKDAAEWKKNWLSKYITKQNYDLVWQKIHFIKVFLITKLTPLVYIFDLIVSVVDFYADGFRMMGEAIREIWEDYYVYFVKDEWNYVRTGIIFLWVKGVHLPLVLLRMYLKYFWTTLCNILYFILG